jgi:hypothetical protein
MVQPQSILPEGAEKKFEFTKKARTFPIVAARPLRWPSRLREADEMIDYWRSRAGKALGMKRLSKKTMMFIASHTSRKDGTCPLSDAALASRTGRSIPSTKRDVCRLKRMGYATAEIRADDGLKRRRVLQLAIPDVIDEDQRIALTEDQRIHPEMGGDWGSTYRGSVDPSEKGERRDV